jgi:hypothetical protein
MLVASFDPTHRLLDMTNTNRTIEATTLNDDAARDGKATGCCGGPPTSNASACCVVDEEVKAAGGAGCGCSTQAEAPKKSCC